ncbi:MAG: VOC family protein [Paracoccaceae bacterium]
MTVARAKNGFAMKALDHLVLTVADIDASVAFYTGVLGMRAEEFRPADGSRRTALKFGRQKINLHKAGAEFEPKATAVQPGSADLCFLSDKPVDEWLHRLNEMAVFVEEGPVRRTGAQGPIQSLYIRDPDGNLIEIANRV